MMKAWEELLSSLENDLGSEAVEQWLRPIRVVRFDAANLYLDATPFQKSWFQEQVLPRIKNRFFNNNQRPIRIHWETQLRPAASQNTAPHLLIRPDSIDPEFSIENLIVNETNQMAIEVAKDLLKLNHPSFNPTFIRGPTGSGKTHLLSAIADNLLKNGKKVFFVSAESFTEHVVQAIRIGEMPTFRKTYRNIDALIVDDVHLLARRAATQEEFFHTFNALHTLEKTIVLSAQNELPDIEPRLISRFEWGITIPLNSPSPPLLRAILEQKIKLLHLKISDAVTDFIIKTFTSSPKAPIVALHAIALRKGNGLDIPSIQILLSDLIAKEADSAVTFEKIVHETARQFGIRPEDILGKFQTREFVQPRQIAMFLIRTLHNSAFQLIGRYFQRDHSTVMASVELVKKAISASDESWTVPIENISRKLKIRFDIKLRF